VVLVCCAAVHVLVFAGRTAVLPTVSALVVVMAFVGPIIGAQVGLWLFRLGRRLSAPKAAEVLEADRRAPVLLLRPFAEDDREPTQTFKPPNSFRYFIPGSTIEERIVEVFASLGPVIAVGRPGELLPPVGAARLYLGNDEWQPRVAELVKRARLVFLIVGATRGVRWEMEQLPLLTAPERVLLFVPGTTPAERAQAYTAFRAALPVEVADRLPLASNVPIIGFDPAWRAVLFEGGQPPFEFATPLSAARAHLGISERFRRPPRLKVLGALVGSGVFIGLAVIGGNERLLKHHVGESARVIIFVITALITTGIVGAVFGWHQWQQRSTAAVRRRIIRRALALAGAAAVAATVGLLTYVWHLGRPERPAPRSAEEVARELFLARQYEAAVTEAEAARVAGVRSQPGAFIAAQAMRARDRERRGEAPLAPLDAITYRALEDVRLVGRRAALQVSSRVAAAEDADPLERLFRIEGIREPRAEHDLMLWDLDTGARISTFEHVGGMTDHAAAAYSLRGTAAVIQRIDLATGATRILEPSLARDAWILVPPLLREPRRSGRYVLSGRELPEIAWDLEGPSVPIRLASAVLPCDGTVGHFVVARSPPELWSLCYGRVKGLAAEDFRQRPTFNQDLPLGSWRISYRIVWSLGDGTVLRAGAVNMADTGDSGAEIRSEFLAGRDSCGKLYFGGTSLPIREGPIRMLGACTDNVIPVVVGGEVRVYEPQEFEVTHVGRVLDLDRPARAGDVLFLPAIQTYGMLWGEATFYDLRKRTERRVQSASARGAFTPDGQLVAAAGPKAFEVWSITGDLLLRVGLPKASGAIRHLELSDDGTRVLVAAEHGATLWDVSRAAR